MQLSKEMSFLTSFSTISFALHMIQLNIALVLCSKIVAHYYYVSMQGNVCFMYTTIRKQAKK